ncbi:hypothetical protein EST38_g2193 [Candolleomyces aberdarensis]|uniref:Uncharacterized protein n=1 Tax=Candolleomyces aberdarensis TaxID=2316362 RepID=A0A4Q2DTU7_9AGAR|nr:hypothetical protein EST38_g2193 [Candolleomyces aberdarensis]
MPKVFIVNQKPASPGDWSDLTKPEVKPPAPLPAKPTATQQKQYDTDKAKYDRDQKRRREFPDQVSAVRDSLINARATLGLPEAGEVTAFVSNGPHASNDPNPHWTFKFTAPKCGGECTGHAYAGGRGKIFNQAGATIWDGAAA